MEKILVMGIGNILLADEGVGVYAVQELEKGDWPENVDFVDGGTFTQDIFYIFKEYDRLLVLDCVRAKHEPGTIYRLTEDDLVKDKDQALSLHDIDLLDSLQMAEMLGKRPKMIVLGVEPKMINWQMGLTEPVQKSFARYVEIAAEEIRSILAETGQA